MSMIQPFMHGSFQFEWDCKLVSHERMCSRNSLWPEVAVKACRILWLAFQVALLKALKSWSKFSAKVAVSSASGGRTVDSTRVDKPAATVCDRTCAANLTSREAKGGR